MSDQNCHKIIQVCLAYFIAIIFCSIETNQMFIIIIIIIIIIYESPNFLVFVVLCRRPVTPISIYKHLTHIIINHILT